MLLPIRFWGTAWAQPPPRGSLDARSIPKDVTPLIPPAMPKKRRASRLLRDRRPPVRAADPARGAGRRPCGGTARSIIPERSTIPPSPSRPTGATGRVKWINDLVDASGDFLPHLLPVDPTLHWANPPGGAAGRDSGRRSRDARAVQRAGADRHPPARRPRATESDGYAEAWYLPRRGTSPRLRHGGHVLRLLPRQSSRSSGMGAGNAVFHYPNDQRAARCGTTTIPSA